jgi:hypothetical protein
MRLTGTGEDTVTAVGALLDRGVRAIAVLGGDGTSRLVASRCADVPLCPLSTGTNNAFPELREATAAGLALGLVATGRVGDEGLRREKLLRVAVRGQALHDPERGQALHDSGQDQALQEFDRSRALQRDDATPDPGVRLATDCALVDVARTSEPWIGARALWRPESIAEAVIAFGEPGAVGLSALAALLGPVPRHAPHALHVVLGPAPGAPLRLRVPLAPGLVAEAGIVAHRRVGPGEPVALAPGSGSLALDGERELELGEGDRVDVTLDLAGPLVVDVRGVLARAAERGLLVEPR